MRRNVAIDMLFSGFALGVTTVLFVLGLREAFRDGNDDRQIEMDRRALCSGLRQHLATPLLTGDDDGTARAARDVVLIGAPCLNLPPAALDARTPDEHRAIAAELLQAMDRAMDERWPLR